MRNFAQMSRFLLYMALGLLAFAGAEVMANEAVSFDFNKKPLPGDKFLYALQQEESTRYIMPVQGLKKMPARQDSSSLSLTGTLTFSDDGAVELQISFFEWFENGKQVARPALRNRTIRIFTDSGNNVQVRIVNLNDDPFLSAVSQNGPSLMLTDAEKKLFAGIFAASDDSLLTFLAQNNKPRKPGEQWPLDTKWLSDMMQQRGFKNIPAQWLGRAEYLGKESWQEIPADTFTLTWFSKDVPGCDIKFDAMLRLPAENDTRGVLSLTRSVQEIVERVMPGGDPFFAGARFRVTKNHHSEQTMLPVKK